MAPRLRPGRTYLSGAPMLVAHRGGSKLAPENTMVAFERAVSWWEADMLELDVRLTRDGHVVVIHDETVDRTTDGSGPVASFTLEEIQALDAGARFVSPTGESPFAGKGVRVPLLSEVLAAFPGMRVNVEAKEARVAGPMVAVIREHGAESRTLVAAEFERWRADARGYPGPWGASRHQAFGFWLLHRLPGGSPYTPPVDIFQVPERFKGLKVVTPRFIEAAQAVNIPVHVWTVDDPDDMKRLLDWGVDGIQTDRPDLLAEVMTERLGRRAPKGPTEVVS